MLDHLIYATKDLEAAVAELGARLGIAPSAGGRHVGRGTRNYLLALGQGSYLEIIGPDPEQPDFAGARSFSLDTLDRPRLAGWAVRTANIAESIETSRARGYDPGPAQRMSRRTPQGDLLSWSLTEVPGTDVPALIPFLIDWSGSVHPSATAAQGARLAEFHAETPDPDRILAAFSALDVSIPVRYAVSPGLFATIRGPGGEVLLA